MTPTEPRLRRSTAPVVALAALLLAAPALAQGGGQGGLSPDTPVLAPQQPGVRGPDGGAQPANPPGVTQMGPAATQNAQQPAGGPPQPKTPLPPRDTPRAAQPGQNAGGPKTPLPSRDTPRAAQPGQQRGAADPDWPCQQVKVAELSYGQMWAGPPLDKALQNWNSDPEVSGLVDDLVARRTKIDDAKAMIDKFAKAAGDKPDEKLTLLFAGVFSEINGQRSQIVSGIERYSRKQRSLSEKIKAESLKIADTQKDMASQMSPEAMQQQQTLDWDTRIYDERSQQLNYVCESPVILEQRAFDLGRAIQAHLTQSSQ